MWLSTCRVCLLQPVTVPSVHKCHMFVTRFVWSVYPDLSAMGNPGIGTLPSTRLLESWDHASFSATPRWRHNSGAGGGGLFHYREVVSFPSSSVIFIFLNSLLGNYLKRQIHYLDISELLLYLDTSESSSSGYSVISVLLNLVYSLIFLIVAYSRFLFSVWTSSGTTTGRNSSAGRALDSTV